MPASNSAMIGSTPRTNSAKPTASAAPSAFIIDTPTTIFPRFLSEASESCWPSRKPISANAILVSGGNQVSTKCVGSTDNPACPMATPPMSSNVTRGRNVKRPTRSATSPRKNKLPRTRRIDVCPRSSVILATRYSIECAHRSPYATATAARIATVVPN